MLNILRKVLIQMVLCAAADTLQCPFESRCTCKTNYNAYDAYCNGTKLTEIPHVPNSVIKLTLARNQITVIPEGAFMSNSKLVHLDLSRNMISMVYARSFEGLVNLQSLLMNNNNLTYEMLSYRKAFEPLVMLKILDVQKNIANSTKLNISYLTNLMELKMDIIANSEVKFDPQFSNLTKLENLSFSGLTGNCRMKILTYRTFTSFQHVKKLDISKCQIADIWKGTFKSLSNLTYLDLSENRCLQFNGLINVTLDLPFTEIKTFKANRIHQIFAMNTEIKKCHIQALQKTGLTELYIDGNRLQRVESGGLSLLPKSLKFISVSDNELSYGDYLFEMYILTVHTVNMSLQVLTHEPRPDEKCDIKHQNDISCHSQEEHLVKRDFENVSKNFWKNVIFLPYQLKNIIFIQCKMRYMIPKLKMSKNQISSIDARGNAFYDWQGPITNLGNLCHLDMSNNFCSNVSVNFFLGAPNIQRLLIQGNLLGLVLPKDKNGEIFAPLRKLEILNLAQNKISTLPRQIFKSQEALKELDLSDNLLEEVEFDINQMKNLRRINLSNNLLGILQASFRQQIDDLTRKGVKLTIHLKGNPFKCSCESIPFLKWLSWTTALLHDIHEYRCQSSDMSLNNPKHILDKLNKECSNYTAVIVGITSLLLISVAITIWGIVYRYRWKLRYLYYIAKNKHHGTIKNKVNATERNFEYDAFVSYADEDSLFVYENFIHNVEKVGGMRCCIHKRDFLVGTGIADNIISAIHSSRKVVVIMSQNFLNSGWCKYEYNIARVESIYSRNNKNIICLIFLQQLLSSELPMTILEYVQSQTYIEYPNDEHGDVVFWDKVRQSISD